ncbi:SAV_6107 family HEPN domain-containing protein [Brachybacterium sp. FME24]|uniref:SAV_6107 family HEPN domain-containing protein n=1 Tax=Brachybacterium sp. FME24 TaxID=2742605 RepID=UPI001865F396|nr:SAV_6107 family HEPN domain-containing protein [Brachybacterium sp. FME24]
MTTTTSRRRRRATALTSDARSLRLRLAHLDQDQADLERARDLLRQGRAAATDEPREAFELVHRAALRGAGIIVARSNRDRRRKLPLNVWTALDRLGGEDAERASHLVPLVAERSRLDREPASVPDPGLLREHLEQTAQHLDTVSQRLLADLPSHVTALAG